MGKWIFAVILLPVLEIFSIAFVGGRIGGWSTFGLLILSAIIGFLLIKQQGMSFFFNAREDLLNGLSPLEQVWDRLMLCLVGILFIFPGFISDIIALLLLLPPLRELVVEKIIEGFKVKAGKMMQSGAAFYCSTNVNSDEFQSSSEYTSYTSGGTERGGEPEQGQVFECEVIEVEKEVHKVDEGRKNTSEIDHNASKF